MDNMAISEAQRKDTRLKTECMDHARNIDSFTECDIEDS